MRRRPQILRGIAVGVIAYAGSVLLAFLASKKLVASLSVLSIMHWEDALYDARVASRARPPDDQPIVVLSLPEPTGDHDLTVRPLLARAIPALRKAGVKAIGVDILLTDARLEDRATDRALASALAGDDVVLASMLDDQGRFERPYKSFRRQVLMEGLINFEKGSDWDRAVRGTRLWSWRESPGEPVPSMALALAVVARARAALDRAGTGTAQWRALTAAVKGVASERASEPREDLGRPGDVGEISKRQLAVLHPVLDALAQVVAAPGSGEHSARATVPGSLMARIEAAVLLRRLGLDGPLTELALYHARSYLTRDFLGVSVAPVMPGGKGDARAAPSFIIDYPQCTGDGGAAFEVLPLVGVARPPAAQDSIVSCREVDPCATNVIPRIREPHRGQGRVAGRVLDGRGDPVASALVLLESIDDPCVAKVRTGRDGRFSVDGLAPGTYRHRIFRSLEGGAVWAKGIGPTVGTTEATMDVIVPAPTATLPAGRAPRADWYWLWTADPPYPATLTDARGAFAIAVPPSRASLAVTTGEQTARWPQAAPSRTATTLIIEAQRVGTELKGTVLNAGRPCAGVRVSMEPEGETYGACIRAHAPPDALPPGVWFVRCYSAAAKEPAAPAPRELQVDLRPGPNTVEWPPVSRTPASAPPLEARLEPGLSGAPIEAVALETGEIAPGVLGAGGIVRFPAATGPTPAGWTFELLARLPGGIYGSALPKLDPLEGKIVLIGTRLVEDHDQFITPFDVGTNASAYGVDIHAVLLENLLSGRGIRDERTSTLWREGDGRVWIALLLQMLLCILVSLAWASLEFTPALFAVAILGLVHRQTAWGLLTAHAVWVDVAGPWLALFLTSTHWLQHHYRTTYRESQRRKDLFSRFVDPTMVTRILDAETIDVLGERSTITVLFSDIRGFTTISERTDPREMLKMLNDYFSVMVPVLKKHGGTLDKYIGDAVMGFFGAPIPSADHALQAVNSAVDMLAANRQLKRERGRWFEIGFGINTGDCVTGLVGDRAGAVNYSAIGDAVNLASRLESLNKECHTEILISESTYLAVREHFETLPMGEVQVKGKLEKVKVYQVLGRKGAAVSAPGTPPPPKQPSHPES